MDENRLRFGVGVLVISAIGIGIILTFLFGAFPSVSRGPGIPSHGADVRITKETGPPRYAASCRPASVPEFFWHHLRPHIQH